jgi:hypothetical protein
VTYRENSYVPPAAKLWMELLASVGRAVDVTGP